MTKPTNVLPPQFADLTPFLKSWTLESQMERTEKRLTSTMKELTEFYDAMLPKMQEILDYLDQYTLQDMPEDAKLLLSLGYSLAEISPAVEMFQQVYVTPTFDARNFLPTHESVSKRPKMSISP